jgi:tripartite-type tricarboxylate transporter receptor subunit TctC
MVSGVSSHRMARWVRVAAFGFLSLLVASDLGRAQESLAPGRHITIVHPFTAGGVGYDLAHVIGDRLRRLFDISVVVEARPGGNTVLGVTSVLKSRPDGHTLLINATSVLSIAGAIYKTRPYDPATDLVPAAFVAKVPLILVVHSQLPVRSIPDFVELARSTSGGLTFASTGTGGAQHLSGEFLKRTLGVDATHVPFGGPSAAAAAVAGGHVAFMFADALNAMPLIESGKVRAVALTTAAHALQLADVPTFAQAGLNGFDFDLRMGLFAPAETPTGIVAKLNSLVRAATSDAEVHARFRKVGVQIIDTPGPEQLAAMHAEELARWQGLVKDAKLEGSQ